MRAAVAQSLQRRFRPPRSSFAVQDIMQRTMDAMVDTSRGVSLASLGYSDVGLDDAVRSHAGVLRTVVAVLGCGVSF